MEKPKPLTEINLDRLKEICQEYLDFFEDPDFTEDGMSDFKDYIFEEAVETLYWEKVWDYVNHKMK